VLRTSPGWARSPGRPENRGPCGTPQAPGGAGGASGGRRDFAAGVASCGGGRPSSAASGTSLVRARRFSEWARPLKRSFRGAPPRVATGPARASTAAALRSNPPRMPKAYRVLESRFGSHRSGDMLQIAFLCVAESASFRVAASEPANRRGSLPTHPNVRVAPSQGFAQVQSAFARSENLITLFILGWKSSPRHGVWSQSPAVGEERPLPRGIHCRSDSRSARNDFVSRTGLPRPRACQSPVSHE